MPESRASATVVLMGMMGAGKTTVGRALAMRTGWRYLDNDALVRTATGRTPEEIDASDGTDALHRAESAALLHALTLRPPLIVAAAAWVVSDPGAMERLRQADAWVVYLRARPETLRTRIGTGHGRRADATDLHWLQGRFEERDETYRAAAVLTLDVDEPDAESVADRILEWLGA